MLLWAGIAAILIGVGCLAIDRRAAHAMYDRVGPRLHRFLEATTHWAKAAHWLVGAVLVYALAQWGLSRFGEDQLARTLADCALAFIASLVVGSAVLHILKRVVARRRPRDDFEMGLHGFRFFTFNAAHNSFPSGHSLTIFCVAVVVTAVIPSWWPLWFALALWLALTRALLTAHYLSDVFIGAGIGLVASREIILNYFPTLALRWF